MLRSLLLTALFLLLTVCKIRGQISYQISNYDLTSAEAGNQNWDISGDGEQRIFVANNNGLLVLENTDQRLYQLPEPTVFRSTAYIEGRIYTGAFEEFGYWKTDANGELSYTSLVPLLDNKDLNNDEIWKIVQHHGKVYFHSFGSIYAYNPEREQVYRVNTQGTFMFLYAAHGELYSQQVQHGLYQLKNDEFIPVPKSQFLENEELKSIIELPDGRILIGTSKGFYTFDGHTFSPWKAERVDEVLRNNVNVMVRTDDKIIIGTIMNGLYIYDLNFRLLQNLNTKNQLQNNTVLSLSIDPYDNVWVGMDNGLDYVAFDTPVHTYSDELDGIGSVYTAALYENALYIGTNQGIYWFKQDENGSFYDKQLLPESQGQVWFLKQFNGVLYAGLNDGTYLIQNQQLQQISTTHGGYNLKEYPGDQHQILLQSTYSDLLVYKKQSGFWSSAYPISGFSAPARYMEFDHLGNIWLGHSVKGIYQLQPNIRFTNIDQVQKIGPQQGLPPSTNKVFKLGSRIMTSYDDTLYQWDSINENFVPYTDLETYFTEKETVQNIIPAGEHQYWVIKKSEISLFQVHFNSIRLLYRMLPEMYNFTLVDGYENIVPLSESLHLICLDDGFAILNLGLVDNSKYPNPSIRIKSVKALNAQNAATDINPKNPNKTELAYRNSTLRISWITSQIVGNQPFFQYKLQGIDDTWSPWGTATQAEYLRLPAGDYSFQVRSVGSDGMLTETASFDFTIKHPWYLSTGAYILYFVALASFVFMIRLYISRKRWKKLGEDLKTKHKKMYSDREQAEKEIIKLRNEKLKTEIDHKSQQLASNTMAMMRKNNLLNSIKEELEKQKKELGDQIPDKYFKQIQSLIEHGIEDEREWELFEQLYNEAHGDFFKRLKEKYPQLTPADLRLCAYLRMNLSSKEIAPLLSISVRGVEERRYRLRKRLDISTDTNLTELIMTF